jgi:hypothetical protein
MVKNLWKQIEVVCGNHEKDYPVMGLKQGHRSLFYSCPKYYPEARQPGERACKNHVSTDDFEKILEKLSEEAEKQMINGQKICLKNLKFKVKTIEVEVIYHVDDVIKLKVKNKKALE